MKTNKARRIFHKVFYAFLVLLITPYFYLFGHYRWKRYRPKAKNYLVLVNHNTDYDFFLTGLVLGRQMYFVASEHIFRQGFVSKLIKFLVDPIPRRKGASADETVQLITERLQAGQNVCMFVEGNRSFFGETGWISPANAPLVRNSGAALVTCALHGGYFVNPRWGKTQRRGPMWGEAVHEYSPEELSHMTDEEILAAIRGDVYVSAYGDQVVKKAAYRCKAPAESLETALFVCPVCHRFSTLHSHIDTLSCASCGMSVTLDDYGTFTGTETSPAPFSTILEWSRWQQDYLTKLLPTMHTNDEPLFGDDGIRLSRVTPGQGTELLVTGRLNLYADRIEAANGEKSFAFPLTDISKLSIVRRDSILFTTPDGYYELRSQTAYAALKYLMCWRLLLGKAYV